MTNKFSSKQNEGVKGCRLFLMTTLFLLTFQIVSAADWDNVKSYDKTTQTITVTNFLGLGGEIASIKLNTPHNNLVPVGESKVAEFTINSKRDFEGVFDDLKFYDLNKGKAEFSRSFTYKYKVVTETIVNDYNENCKYIANSDIKNTTKEWFCSQIIIGNHTEKHEEWLPLTKSNISTNEILTIGIFVNVEKGDKVEWIPKLFGVTINEWATWTSSLNAGLVVYYNFENTTATQTNLVDNVFNNINCTWGGGNPQWIAGKIGRGLNFNGTNWANCNQTGGDSLLNFTTNLTISVWVNVGADDDTSGGIITKCNWNSGNCDWSIDEYDPLKVYFQGYNEGWFNINQANYFIKDEWMNVVATYSNGNMSLYKNGTMALNAAGKPGILATAIQQLFIGIKVAGNNWAPLNASFDEIGIWNRTLSGAEIADLYNGGTGITYIATDATPPLVTINTPLNTTYGVTTIVFNVTATDGTGVSNCFYKLDNSNYTMVNSGNYWTDTNTTMTKGYHTTNFYCNDTSNNLNDTSNVQFTISTASTVTLNQPIDNYNSSLSSVTLNCSAEDNIGVQNLSMAVDGSIVETATGGVGQNISIERADGLTDGSHTWNCSAWNTNSQFTSSVVRNFIIDTLDPVISYSTGTEGNNTNFSRDWIYIDITSTEANFKNITYLIANSTNVTHSFTTSYTNFTNFTSLVDGIYFYNVTIWDIVSHSATTNTRMITLDTINPNIEIIAPTNNSNTTNTGLDITYTASDSNLYSCWYSVDSGVTNTTLTGCGSITTETWAEGSNTVMVWANDYAGNVNVSTVVFNLDTLPPKITLINPLEGSFSTSGSKDIKFNVTISHPAGPLGSCVYYDNSTNNTITCRDNVTISSNVGFSTFKYWANDTAGNMGSNSTTFFLTHIENSQTFNVNATEGNAEAFSINISYDPSYYTNAVAKLVYAGTSYIGSQSGTGTNRIFTRTITIPSVTTDTINTFYWTFDFIHNSSLTTYINSSFNNQTAMNLLVDNCSASTTLLLNYTLRDELSQEVLDGPTYNTSIETFIEIFPLSSTTPIVSYSQKFINISSAPICINSTLIGGNYLLGAITKYAATDYSIEYNVKRFIPLNSTTLNQDVNLLILPVSSTTTFKITYKDTSFLPVSNAVIDIARQYLSEGVFKTVERPMTDYDGKTTASLIKDSGIYNFYVYKNNTLIGNFLNVIPVCQNPILTDCLIDLNSFSSSIPVSNFTYDNDFLFTLSNNRTSRITTLDFSIPSGSVSTIVLNVTKFDALGTNACTSTLTTSAGSLTCNYAASIGNGTLMAKIYKDGVLVGSGHLSLEKPPNEIWGGIVVFLAIFLIITVAGAGLSDSPVLTIIFFMIGVILLFALNLVAHNGFIGATATILWLVMAIIIVITKGARR